MPDSFSDNNTFVFVADDSDFISISYGGRWTHNTNGSDFLLPAYNDTGSQGVPGATASMLFSGFSVAAYAAIPASVGDLITRDPDSLTLAPPNVTVTLDDDTPTRVSVPLGLNTPFFTHGALADDRPHRLLISVDDANVNAAFPFVLDSVVYATHIAAASAPPTPPGDQQRLSPTETGRAGAFFTAVTVQNVLPPPEPLPVAAIVGGVVGGVTLIVAAALAIYWIVRSRRLRRMAESYFAQTAMTVEGHGDNRPLFADDGEKALSQTSATTGPVDRMPASSWTSAAFPTPPFSSESAPSAPSMASRAAPSPPSSVYDAASASRNSSSHAYASPPPSLTGSASARRRKAQEAGLLSSVPEAGAPNVNYHADSGVRFTDQGGADASAASREASDEMPVLDSEDVPPSYSAS